MWDRSWSEAAADERPAVECRGRDSPKKVDRGETRLILNGRRMWLIGRITAMSWLLNRAFETKLSEWKWKKRECRVGALIVGRWLWADVPVVTLGTKRRLQRHAKQQLKLTADSSDGGCMGLGETVCSNFFIHIIILLLELFLLTFVRIALRVKTKTVV